VMNADECRKKATWCMRVARLTKNQDASLSWRRLSDAWLTLAENTDEKPMPEARESVTAGEPRPKPAEPPPQPAESPRIAAMKVADLLRGRLALDSGPRAEGPKA
jgi:hypothetical protein